MEFAFTRLGKVFLGVSGLLYLASLTSQSGLMLLLIGIVAGCYVVNFIVPVRSLRALDLVPPPTIQLAENEAATQPWQLTNRTSHSAYFIEALLDRQSLFRVGQLPAQSSRYATPELQYQRRGVYRYSQLRLASSYPFGLARVERSLGLSGDIIVYPAIYETPCPPASGFDVTVGGKFHGAHRTTTGTQFAGIRPLQPWDPLRQVHWKSSAKGRGLMVKTYDEELSGRVGLILSGRNNSDSNPFDDCVRAAGSLMFSALDAGHHVEWLDLATSSYRLVPPFFDLEILLEMLARVEAHPGPAPLEVWREAINRLSPRSAIALVLTEFTPAISLLVAELKEQRRSVSIYLPASPPDLGRIVESGIPAFVYSATEIQPLTHPIPESEAAQGGSAEQPVPR